MLKRKILIITERRADYSRFKPIINLIKKSKRLSYELIVTGSHLLKKHGFTIKEIKKDNIKIHYQIKNFIEKKNINDGESMILALGKIFIEISKIIKKSKPDIILSGFDIGANFALTVAGAHLNIPVAHIQGGEVTGSIDESLRHAMSKFSNYHLVANNDAKKRLIKMGERRENIFNVGCPSIDALFKLNSLAVKYAFTNVYITFSLLSAVLNPDAPIVNGGGANGFNPGAGSTGGTP